MKLQFLLQHPREKYWISQENDDDFTQWNRIGIRTRIDDSLIFQGGLSSPTHGDDHQKIDKPAPVREKRLACHS